MHRRIIAACVPAEDERAVLDDIDALHAARARRYGAWRAGLWLTRQTLGFVVRVALGRFVEFLAGPDGLRSELRRSARTLSRQPAFALTFVVTLAVGIGVLSTVFAAARWVVLRPVPGVLAPDDLFTIRLSMKGAPAHVAFDVSEPNLQELRDRLPVQGALAGASAVDLDLSRAGAESRRVAGELVSTNYLTVLGTRLIAGRNFAPSDGSQSGARPTAIVSQELSRSLAPSAEDAVGLDIRINGSLVRVIGVTPRGFRGAELPGRAQIWLPLSALRVVDPTAEANVATNRMSGVWRKLIGRAAPGTPASLLQTEANAVMAAIRREFPQGNSFMMMDHRFLAFPGIGLDPAVRDSVQRTLGLLGAASALLLLLAIANLANLTLIRATVTSTATAIRFALGASNLRIARAVFIDALVLGSVGCAGGLALAVLWSRWYQLTRLDEHGAPLAGMGVDARIAAVAFGAAILASAIAFLKPALTTRFAGLERQLRQGKTGTAGTRLRITLVAVQVSLSVLLLIGSGLLGRTVSKLRDIDLGFEPNRILTMAMDPHLHGFEGARLAGFAREFERRTAAVQGAAASGVISPAPFTSSYVTASMHRVAGKADPSNPATQPVIGAGYYVSPGLLKAIGARVIAGQADWRADSGTVVLTRTAVTRLFPGVDPRLAAGRVIPIGSRQRPTMIAAVIEDLVLSDITSEPPPAMFLPLGQRIAGLTMMALVSTEGRPERLATPVRRAVAEISTELPVFDVRTARQAVDQQFAARDAMARAASTLGVIGLLLAALGLYGVLAHLVAARHREFGIRAAMGATPGRIVRGVVAGGFLPVVVGLAIGLAGATGVSRALRSQLFELEPFDPLTYASAIGILALAAVVACAIPAFRASRVAPAEVLRE